MHVEINQTVNDVDKIGLNKIFISESCHVPGLDTPCIRAIQNKKMCKKSRVAGHYLFLLPPL